MALAARLVLVAVCLASVPAIAVVAKSAPLGADNSPETRIRGFGPETQARTGARAHPTAEAHWGICSKAPRCAAGALVQRWYDPARGIDGLPAASQRRMTRIGS
ncbi:MAG: hypothetical protein ACYC8T_36720 [Myxococcaceae bacterium]